MPTFSLLYDLPTAVVVYVISVTGTVWWIHHSSQTEVSKDAEVTGRAIIRLAIVVGIVFAFCFVTTLPFWVPVVGIALSFVLIHTGDWLALPGVVGVAMMWLIQQFVLGFPARGDLLLERPPLPPGATDLAKYVGQQGVTVTPLKPSGEILVGNLRFQATSDFGEYLAADLPILVTGTRLGRLLVQAIP